MGDKAKKAMVDAARLADELRAEQDHCAVQEKAKLALTSQLSELEGRLADANEAAAKGGRNAMAKLESRIREMEIELGSVQSKTSDAYKAFQKAERRIKELQFQQDEDKKNQDSMSCLGLQESRRAADPSLLQHPLLAGAGRHGSLLPPAPPGPVQLPAAAGLRGRHHRVQG